MNTFKFVGKIAKVEEKGEKKFIETKTFDSGWMIKRVKFRVTCGESSELVDVSGGKWTDDSKNVVYTLAVKDGSSNQKDVEKIQVKWVDRFKPEVIERIPKYKRYTVDLASDNLREKYVTEKNDAALEAISNTKFSYISQYDFAAKVEELITSGAFGDANYVISGNVEWNYSPNKEGKLSYYRSFIPTNIYLADPSEAASMTGKIDFYYNKEDYMGETLENGDTPVTGYVQYYDSMAKSNYFAPVSVSLKNGYDRNDGFKKFFASEPEDGEDAQVMVVGLLVEYFSGAPKSQITFDDLSPKEQEMVEWGVKTLDEFIKEKGGSIYEQRVSRIYVTGISRGCTAPQNANVDLDVLDEKPSKDKKSAKTTATTKSAKTVTLLDDDDEI